MDEPSKAKRGWGCAIAVFVVIAILAILPRKPRIESQQPVAVPSAPMVRPFVTTVPAIAPAASPPPAPKPSAAQRPECRLSVAGVDSPVPLFPTKEGLDEYVRAISSDNTPAALLAIRMNGALAIEKGTACIWLDVGLLTTKVRISEGPNAGRVGFVPSEWAQGKR